MIRDKHQAAAAKTTCPPDRDPDDTVPGMLRETGSAPAADNPQAVVCQEKICNGEEACFCSSCEEDAPQERPVVTLTLIALCGVAYALQWIVPGFTEAFWFAPVHTSTEPWRMLTIAFLHHTVLIPHIAFNLYALWVVGKALEPALGHLNFLLVYLVSALGGSIGIALLAPAYQASVGASGAIFGLLGAVIVVQLWDRDQVKGLLILLGINLAVGFIIPIISWQGHLGGLLTGAACALVILYATERPRYSMIQFGGLAAIAVALLSAGLLWAPAL